LEESSNIQGSKVIIHAPSYLLHIKKYSWIDVSERSTNDRGTDTNENKKNGAGASYVASGGSKCDANLPSKRYSQFDILPDINVHDMKQNQLLGSKGFG
jgi:hypothetical protein